MLSLSMGKGRFAALIAAVLAVHLVLVNIDSLQRTDEQDEILVTKKLSLQLDEQPDGLIIGGSNAYYGLSARILSDETPLRFVNLSLLAEGNGWPNYFEYLQDLEILDRERVRVVIYSTLDIMSGGRGEHKAAQGEDVIGRKKGLLVFDRNSWMAKFNNWFIGRNRPQIRARTTVDAETGDLVFRPRTCNGQLYTISVTQPTDALAMVEQRLEAIRGLFPNAAVFLRIPPLAAYEGYRLDRFYADVGSYARDHGIELLNAADPTFDTNLVCDGPQHPTEAGRRALSLALAKQLNRHRPEFGLDTRGGEFVENTTGSAPRHHTM